MSRSNPTTEKQPNPCTRWHDWRGGKDGGNLEWFNKDTKQRVDVPGRFTFIVLDELACVKGWHDASDSGIMSNEVRDTKAEPLSVRAFKGGELANGLYATIRDRVTSQGGHFVANIYCAYKDGTELKLGSIQFKGAALNAWVEFKKAHRKEIYSQAVTITGYTEGKKGSITFRVPAFAVTPISPETNEAASKIDSEVLQPYLSDYFRKNTSDKVMPESDSSPDENAIADAIAMEQERAQLPSDDMPF